MRLRIPSGLVPTTKEKLGIKHVQKEKWGLRSSSSAPLCTCTICLPPHAASTSSTRSESIVHSDIFRSLALFGVLERPVLGTASSSTTGELLERPGMVAPVGRVISDRTRRKVSSKASVIDWEFFCFIGAAGLTTGELGGEDSSPPNRRHLASVSSGTLRDKEFPLSVVRTLR